MEKGANQEIIIALATPQGESAVAIIRLSGQGCIEMTEKLFSRSLTDKPSHTIHYGQLLNKDETLDDCLISIFKAPTSYTKEDSVEISCHGSPFIIEKIIKVYLRQGARIASNGEYTKRAFLNGQLDLSQAEAVADLIASDSDFSHALAIKQLKGGVSNDLKLLRTKLIDFASLIELELDFGEEDLEFASRPQIEKTINEITQKIKALLDSFNLGNSLKNGIPIVIAGKPNAGKSTLLNALLNTERAIVSSEPGTTRDTIDDYINIEGVKFLITDTAGIRQTDNVIEKIGVSKTMEKIDAAQVLLYVTDAAQATPKKVWAQLEKIDAVNSKLLLIINKMDLHPTLKPSSFYKEGLLEKENIIPISAINKMNLSLINDRLLALVQSAEIKNLTMITNTRHYESLQQALQALQRVSEGLSNKVSSDFLAMDIRHALHYLGLITGEIHTDDLLNNIFSNFCIGK